MPYFKDVSINISNDWIMCFVYTEVKEIYSVTGKKKFINSILFPE